MPSRKGRGDAASTGTGSVGGSDGRSSVFAVPGSLVPAVTSGDGASGGRVTSTTRFAARVTTRGRSRGFVAAKNCPEPQRAIDPRKLAS